MKKLPELLAPAGSPEALLAAIEGGADAVYLGASLFSNRMRARNFDESELREALRVCNIFGVSAYITMNTRLRDRELSEALDLAEKLWDFGATAFIVADVGLAALLRERIPGVKLHASTQMTGVNSLDAAALRSLGFERMVCPRELSKEGLFRLVENSPIEIEGFVHGAHCVSLSGQCLMSWAMGGRSGNRGECAQPCRLPYKVEGAKNLHTHPLSLKDMCLASHVPSLIESGVSSLKIEGRLKSADYVYGVTKIYRRLLDERRGATPEEISALEAIFSRDGFTDGYFKNNFSRMVGMRPESATSGGEKFTGLTRKIPVTAKLTMKAGEKLSLTLTKGDVSVTVFGQTCEAAKSAGLDFARVLKSIGKLGDSYFSLAAEDFTLHTEGEVFVPVSALNALRREAVSELEKLLVTRNFTKNPIEKNIKTVPKAESPLKMASFETAEQLTPAAKEYFDVIFIREELLNGRSGEKFGLDLPPYAPSSEKVEASLRRFAENGGKRVLCHTLGQIFAAKREKLSPIASMRLNCTNEVATAELQRLGAEAVILSPELNLPAMRDISKSAGSVGAVVYGRLPLMTVRRCILADSPCSGKCGETGCGLPKNLLDRKGEKFPLLPIGDKINVIYNSVPLYSADLPLGNYSLSHHFYVFSVETAARVDGVIKAYERGLSGALAGISKIKRI